MVWYPNSQGRYGVNGAKGDLGESIVEEYCSKNGIVFELKTDINSQVNLKIDCIINGVTVDVKTNYYKGSLAVELYTQKSGAGWLFKTTAKQIYGVDIETRSVFRYNVDAMIAYVTENKQKAIRTKKGDVIMYVSVKNKFIEQLQ